ncbi:hypothetical protein F5X71_08310 [Nocardia brasiliensis]|uniref:Knottins-like domain-containing protein n=1 Tax=Nocardia brasiliensis TaxID=37326 RepID=A0A6G9XNA1_NOCBR|nr:hypothetical protein F5X71_08310 [Nocardia brasiliensis]
MIFSLLRESLPNGSCPVHNASLRQTVPQHRPFKSSLADVSQRRSQTPSSVSRRHFRIIGLPQYQNGWSSTMCASPRPADRVPRASVPTSRRALIRMIATSAGAGALAMIGMSTARAQPTTCNWKPSATYKGVCGSDQSCEDECVRRNGAKGGRCYYVYPAHRCECCQ